MQILIIGGNGVLGKALQAHFDRIGIQYKIAKACATIQPGTIGDTPTYNLYKGEIEGLDYGNFSKKKIAILLAGISNPTKAYSDKLNSYNINFLGTIKILEKLEQFGYWTFFVSSVEVFPGKKIDYKETDSPEPLNWYGQLKCRVEEFIMSRLESSTILRTGWNIPATQHRTGRDPVEVTYRSLLSANPRMAVDNYFTPISAEDFAIALTRIAQSEICDARIIHIASSEIYSRSEFADLILATSRNVDLNRYDKVFHHDFYSGKSELRGRINGLSNKLLTAISPMTFTAIENIVTNRIRQLDEIYRREGLHG
jgi:dTDP-4-dehydrorhamnose reductase